MHRCRIFKADSRVDIGGLCHYKDALHGLCDGQKVMRRADEPAVGRAYPRVGLLGNPSDGYGGKVIAVAIESEGYAEAIAVPSLRFEIVRNADMELSADFEDTAAFFDEVGSKGVRYGAHALVMAAAIIFARAIKERKSETGKKVEQLSNCKLIYSTCIPSCIGLSGSSALILAGLRALARFHGTTLEEVNADIKTWPVWMRQAELEMGIACGLMDRVIQVMHGCVWMDFSGKGAGSWERLDEKKLPELWTVYKNENGTCSGVVHGSLKRRFEAGDEDMRETICKLSQVAEEGKTLFQTGEWTNLPELMRRNFELREQLVGDVGHANRHLIRVANEAGFSAKMCGSGGSAICIANTARQLDLAEVERARKMLEQHGMVLHRVKVLKRRTWGAGNITKPKKKELDKV